MYMEMASYIILHTPYFPFPPPLNKVFIITISRAGSKLGKNLTFEPLLTLHTEGLNLFTMPILIKTNLYPYNNAQNVDLLRWIYWHSYMYAINMGNFAVVGVA